MTGTKAQRTRDGSGEMFDRIADRYDLLNHLMSLGMDVRWRDLTVDALGLRPSDCVLDLATGTADLAVAIARREPTVHVVGVDPSARMLDVGRRKVARLGLEARVALEIGDAQFLAQAAHRFDGLCMAFGIRNVPDRRLALQEMARVVRPGRHVCILELSEPGSGWLGSIARWYVHTVVPSIGAALSGAQEYRYLQQSIAAFPSPRAFAAMMDEAGLEVLKIARLGFGACHLYVATPKEPRL